MSNYKTVFFTLGVLQVILGLAMIIPVIIQFIYNELDSSFISSGIITIVFGILFIQRESSVLQVPFTFAILHAFFLPGFYESEAPFRKPDPRPAACQQEK